jgi:hypothetical protein
MFVFVSLGTILRLLSSASPLQMGHTGLVAAIDGSLCNDRTADPARLHNRTQRPNKKEPQGPLALRLTKLFGNETPLQPRCLNHRASFCRCGVENAVPQNGRVRLWPNGNTTLNAYGPHLSTKTTYTLRPRMYRRDGADRVGEGRRPLGECKEGSQLNGIATHRYHY